jgi:lysophospholipase L1-like esterase
MRHSILVIGVGLIAAAAILWRDERPEPSPRLVDDYPDRPALVDHVKADGGPIDILLLGDSITACWTSRDTGAMNIEWNKRFGIYKTINAGHNGAKVEDILLQPKRGIIIAALQPRLVILMIGINNLIKDNTNAEALAKAIETCVAKVLQKFPKADVIIAKILPAHVPGEALSDKIKKTNAALDRLKLNSDQKVHVLDLTHDFEEPDGALKEALFVDNVHLSLQGYGIYAERLKPLVKELLGGKALGSEVPAPAR